MAKTAKTSGRRGSTAKSAGAKTASKSASKSDAKSVSKSVSKSAVTKPAKVGPSELVTLLDHVRFAVSRFNAAELVFAHGTTDPVAEAIFLVGEALSLHHVRAREWKGELVLLHELADGPADRSYGLAVARLAGMPPVTVQRAKAVLAKLEAGRAKTGGLAAGLDDLPLFAAAAQIEEVACDVLREDLAKLDIDAMSPRDALGALYRLKALATEG